MGELILSMDARTWAAAKSLLAGAAGLPTPEREQYIREKCHDPALREELVQLASDPATLSELVAGPALAPGIRIGVYVIESLLGRGGMGEVYRARDPKLNRVIAIKVLPEATAADPKRRARFEREAQSIAALSHPNIVTIYSVEDIDGVLCLTMEYVDGKPLTNLIGKSGLPLPQLLSIAIPLADAISAAHEKGITHRDLKPGNVMIGADRRVKVLDFGLAKLIEAPSTEIGVYGSPTATLTGDGRILGTVAYMSPEQAEGKPLDHRSDVFSLGVMLYEMAIGVRPFKGDTNASTISSILRDTPQTITELNPDLPRDLARIVRRCLVKDVEHRYQTAKDLRNDLEDLQRDLGSGELSAHPSPRGRSNGWWPAIFATVIAVVVLWTTLVQFGLGRFKREPVASTATTVTLTGNAGREEQPALSPDGKQVAYSWNGGVGDNFNIFVKLVGAGAPVQLTNHTGVDLSPAWSPDGRFIAFLRRYPERDEIFTIPAIGGSERKVGEAHPGWVEARSSPEWQTERLAWSSDGKLLAFVDKVSEDAPKSIYVLTLDTGEKRRVTSPPPDSLGDGFPAFSPDGQHLAFTRSSAVYVRDIFVVAVGADGAPTEEARRLTFDDRDVFGLDWTADGRHIVFSSNRASGPGLWRISASGGVIQPVPATGEDAYSPAIARAGESLAYAHQISHINIWRVETQGAKAPLSRGNGTEPRKFISSRYWNTAPQFSPDGKRIVFASSRSGSGELWVCDGEGLNPVQLTSFGGPQAGSPRWSPDGQRIAFDAPKEGHTEIYVISADGGPERRVTVGTSDNVRPSWSRDGRWIYFGSRRTGEWQIWKAPVEGGTGVQITKHGGREAFVSRDGKFVYYAKVGVRGIWRVPAGGGEETQVLDQGWMSHWALADEGIYLLDTRSTPPAIEVFSFVSNRLRRIATLPRQAIPTDGFFSRSITVSPDGRSILYVQADDIESEIRLLLNFR